MKERQPGTIATRNFLPAPADPQKLLELCVNDNSDPADIYQGLVSVVKQTSREIGRIAHEDEIAMLTDRLNHIAGHLRSFTRKQDSIRFYYFGMFQAWSDILTEKTAQEQEEHLLLSVITRKRAGEIIRYLYQNDNAQHKELVQDLSILPSNLSKEISLLIDTRLVHQRKMGKFVYYSLTPQGVRAYKQHLVNTGSYSHRKKETEIGLYRSPVPYQKKPKVDVILYPVPAEQDLSIIKFETYDIPFASKKLGSAPYEQNLSSMMTEEENESAE